ncbi:MAG: diacylglycerol kinase family protein [Ruminococcus sp.]|nr:diacylglycerol kinase family protein [Ruminococcus sp.]
MIYILYNPLASSGKGESFALDAKNKQTEKCELRSVIDMDMKSFVSQCAKDDTIILCGGDGTLNRFANDVYDIDYPCSIYLYKSGTGNDFLKDVEDKMQDNMLYLNDYISNLPTVTVNGETRRFVNGIGFGIDGMCCEVADQLAAKGKKADYTVISIKLLIHGYKCPDAVVTVDGKKHEFKKVWLASGMNGRYYGGGMMVTPTQQRLSDKLTSCIFYGSGKLKTLIVFPSLFKGEHIKQKKHVELLTGKEITVEFNIPTAMQIDGETVLGVTSYTIRK